jgi:hypothetical protein
LSIASGMQYLIGTSYSQIQFLSYISPSKLKDVE